MAKNSAGILLYRKQNNSLEVLLVHPGGPFWAKKDLHAWSIPKGEFTEEEDPEAAARREFAEETGIELQTQEKLVPLTPAKQSKGKTVYAFAVARDCDPATIRSNQFEMEWPPHSGVQQQFPEIDRAEWFPLAAAKEKIHQGQVILLDELQSKIGAG